MSTLADVLKHKIDLLEVLQNIKKIFGVVDFSISLETDHDNPTWESVVLEIHTDAGPEDALDLLDRFYEEYWLDHGSNDIIVMVNPKEVDEPK